MTLMFGLHFDFRNPPFAGTALAERYDAGLDIVEWADRLGCADVSVSEHHGSADGYLRSPLVMVAAMAARTRTVRFTVAALTAPFYDPGRRAEGSSEPAARRAARIADGFIPSIPEAWTLYRDELEALGRPDPGPCPVGGTQSVALAEDPDGAWERLGPYFLHETNAYSERLVGSDGAGPHRGFEDVGHLRAAGQYRIRTPEASIEELKEAPFPFALLHPLCGGLTPDLAWESLQRFERRVLPAFA